MPTTLVVGVVTLKELKELSDEQIIRKILYERFSDLSPYSPLGERLVKFMIDLIMRKL